MGRAYCIRVEKNGKKSKQSTAEKKSNTAATLQAPSPNRGISLNRGVSFDIRNLPITETMLDRGHSLAMSEISLDRGQSLTNLAEANDSSNGGGFPAAADEGQFDDASEDEETQGTPAKSAMDRGMTIGTINTFSDLISEKSSTREV